MIDELLKSLRSALGAEAVVVGDAVPDQHFRDSSKLLPSPSAALLLPSSTAQVSDCLRICHAAGQRVVVQGGMTGLAGGAVPQPGEIAISLRRMNGVEEVDVDGMCLIAQAGAQLATVQEAANAAGLHCGIDLGSRGSCTIGGNVATNAGGNHVVRYGMTRRNILGLEAVLADGTVVSHLNRMLKNNTGYDWVQLLVGSEGTLAVITRVVLALHPMPRSVQTALCAVADVEALHLLRRRLASQSGRLLTFEAMWREYMGIAIDDLGLRQPFAERPDITVLVEAEGMDTDAFDEFLAGELENETISDALIARSMADRDGLWSYREATYSFDRLRPRTAAYDISVPHNRMADFARDFRARMAGGFPGSKPMFFGHFADGNLHLSIAVDDIDDSLCAKFDKEVYALVSELGGSVSAEHGIGVAKRAYLHLSRSDSELRLMRRLKLALDPTEILNRDRIIQACRYD